MTNTKENAVSDTRPKAWKLEGEAFEKVKAIVAEHRKAIEDAKAATKSTHTRLWDAIHDVLPESNRDVNHSLNTEHEALGFYVVKENKDDCGLGAALLSALCK